MKAPARRIGFGVLGIFMGLGAISHSNIALHDYASNSFIGTLTITGAGLSALCAVAAFLIHRTTPLLFATGYGLLQVRRVIVERPFEKGEIGLEVVGHLFIVGVIVGVTFMLHRQVKRHHQSESSENETLML